MKTLILTLPALIAVFFTSCEKAPLELLKTADSKLNTVDNQSSLNIKMTDAPADYNSLNLVINMVQVHHEDSGWITLNSDDQAIDVLTLVNGLDIEIASSNHVFAGSYDSIKIDFSDKAELGIETGLTTNLLTSNASAYVSLEWANSSEVVIEVDLFLDSGAEAEVLLDFDVAQSIEEDANSHIIDPVIIVLEDTETGIKGAVEASANAFISVTSDQGVTHSTYANANGEFQLTGLSEGTYDVEIEAKNESTGLNQSMGFKNVVVVAGEYSILK